jgi:hypothetical protein
MALRKHLKSLKVEHCFEKPASKELLAEILIEKNAE